jgi:AcrR family transcriptional regulator
VATSGPERTRRVVSYDEVVHGGARHFLARGGLAMDDLASELAVSRATLYRVAGTRDRLLGDVLWHLGSRTLADAFRGRSATGVAGVVEVTRHFCDALARSGPFRRFLAEEPQTAARVLLTPAGRVHERFIVAQTRIFRDCLDLAAAPADTELRGRAYLYVRIVESVLYGDMLHGGNPTPAVTNHMLRAVLTDLAA